MLDVVTKKRDRLAMRASTTYILRSVDLMSRVVGGDILNGVIFTAIIDANVRHLRPSDFVAQTYSDFSNAVPDEFRRPISVHALALELAVPYETTRRHVNRLINDGFAARADAGVIVPAEVLGRDAIASVLRKNFDNLRRLFADLRDGGVDLTH